MLGGKSIIVKTLTEYRKTEQGNFWRAPIMAHYLPTSNSLVAVHLPYVSYQFNNSLLEKPNGNTMGDIEIMAKYQFYRKDEMGKTFRLVAKTLQTLATGKALGIRGISTGQYQSYVGIVAGYESLRYGISNELGYNVIPNSNENELRYKLGFGLPLLKQSYPVKQLNLYFEYNSSWLTQRKQYSLYYAQGIQYAIGKFTFELAAQIPFIQYRVPENEHINYSLFTGMRYVLN